MENSSRVGPTFTSGKLLVCLHFAASLYMSAPFSEYSYCHLRCLLYLYCNSFPYVSTKSTEP